MMLSIRTSWLGGADSEARETTQGTIGLQRLSGWLLVAAGLFAMLAAGGAQAAVESSLIALDAAQQRAFGIELVAPEAAGETLTRRYPAQVAVPNRQMRVVAAPQNGLIQSLLVAEGERVTADQVLAELRSPELVDLQSQYLEATSQLALADSELARDRMLQREGVIAERRLIETRAKQQELTTRTEQRRQLLALAGLSVADIDELARTRQLSSTLRVHAPIPGVVLEQMVSTGQSVAAAAPIYRIAELKPLWLEVHVPIDRLGGLRAGGRVQLPAEGIEGTIITIGRMVHEADQGVLVRAEVQEGADRLRPGQFVEVQLTSNAAEKGWRVPLAAVVRDGGQAYVFVAREGGFAALPVSVLAEEERSVFVSGELSDADRVASSGVVALKAAWLGAAATE